MPLRIKSTHLRHRSKRFRRVVFFAVVATFLLGAFLMISPRISFLVNAGGGSGNEGVVFQDNPNSCGAAAMKMVLESHGIDRSLGDLERDLRVRSGGVSMLMLKEYAERSWLKAQGWKLSPEDLLPLPKPAILFVHKHHYVVLDSVATLTLMLRDPGFGRVEMTKEQLQTVWNGEALSFRVRPGGMAIELTTR